MTAASWNWLWQRERPYYGQLLLWAVLICAAGLAGYFVTHPPIPGLAAHVDRPMYPNLASYFRTEPAPPPAGCVRSGPASVLSFLPDRVLLAPLTLTLCGGIFAVGAILWALGRLIPWSGWMTALGFTALMALQMEGSSQTTHVAHATNLMLLVNALWYHCAAPEIRRARAAGLFWQTPLYPGWAYGLSVFCLGLFYGYSGLSKWIVSGWSWPNGLSLQLWVRLWGNPDSWASQLIMSNRQVARVLQITTLLGEVGGLVAVVSRRLRPVVGLALISFHAGAINVFGWGFHANLVLLALVFLPVPEAIRWLLARRERGVGVQTNGRAEVGDLFVALAPEIK